MEQYPLCGREETDWCVDRSSVIKLDVVKVKAQAGGKLSAYHFDWIFSVYKNWHGDEGSFVVVVDLYALKYKQMTVKLVLLFEVEHPNLGEVRGLGRAVM
jgi:hypothetical protein